MLLYDLQLFAKEGPGGEKTEEATPKKLEDARKEGQVAKSKELAVGFTLFAMFVLLKIWVTWQSVLNSIQEYIQSYTYFIIPDGFRRYCMVFLHILSEANYSSGFIHGSIHSGCCCSRFYNRDYSG